MATADETHPLGVAGSPRSQSAAEASLKRKASFHEQDESPKRTKHDQDDAEGADDGHRRDSFSARRESREVPPSIGHDRRMSATQEEKKRGKRLFGGLLNTLSQTTSNSQQKRRREIERRQQERMQKQDDEDEQKRTARLARLREIRMAEQIAFDEEVMACRHSKMLAMARFLQTSSEPRIFYLPWKLTARQEDEIDNRIRDAKAKIEEEVASFQARKERHIKEYGPSRRPVKPAEGLPPTTKPESHADGPVHEPHDSDERAKPLEKERHPGAQKDHHKDHHDEADVVEEADEDMVIY